jgi:ribonucleoside-diphosphate reductase alpha chain
MARQMGVPTDGPEWVTADDLTPSEHIKMAQAVQLHVDSAVSKTINCPTSMTFEEFGDVYKLAYESGLKGCSTYRPSGVRGAVLLKAEEPKAVKPEGGNVVQFAEPAARPEVVRGETYKVKPAGAEHALYVTINDIDDGGRYRPFELFLNSKQVDGQAWMVALSRMISGVFRKGGDVRFVAEELKAVHDPRGGYWKDGRYVPSLSAAIGDVIKRHMDRLGSSPEPQEKEIVAKAYHCPKCQRGRLLSRENCMACDTCDYTKC